MAEMATLVKDTFGWDLNSAADRDRIRQEALKLDDVLHTVPNDVIDKNQALLALRDVADGIKGTVPCRGRCLP